MRRRLIDVCCCCMNTIYPSDMSQVRLQQLDEETRSNDNQNQLIHENTQRMMQIDPKRQRYPYCILWSPLAPITWCFPFIGHTGIANSQGVIYDFAGPYTIGKQHMAFGPPTRYIQLDPSLCEDMDWDLAVEQGCDIYAHRMHNICCDNCHSHVAQCLNLMGYNKKNFYIKAGKYNMIYIAMWFFFTSPFVSVQSCFITFIPFLLLVAVIVLAVCLSPSP